MCQAHPLLRAQLTVCPVCPPWVLHLLGGCSCHFLSFLEAAHPPWDLTSRKVNTHGWISRSCPQGQVCGEEPVTRFPVSLLWRGWEDRDLEGLPEALASMAPVGWEGLLWPHHLTLGSFRDHLPLMAWVMLSTWGNCQWPHVSHRLSEKLPSFKNWMWMFVCDLKFQSYLQEYNEISSLPFPELQASSQRLPVGRIPSTSFHSFLFKYKHIHICAVLSCAHFVTYKYVLEIVPYQLLRLWHFFSSLCSII